MNTPKTAPLQITLFCATPMALPCIAEAARLLTAQLDFSLSVKVRCKDDLLSEASLADAEALAKESSAVIFLPHGEMDSIPGFDRLYEAAKGAYTFVQATSGVEAYIAKSVRLSDSGSREKYIRQMEYLHRGGTANIVAFLQTVLAEITDYSFEIPAAEAVPFDGIYHPDLPGTMDVASYLEWAKKRVPQTAAPLVVGLWFYQGYWLNRETEAIDSVIREIEAQGAVVLPVFHRRFPDPALGNEGAVAVCRDYFRRGNKTIIDVLLSPMSFCLSAYGDLMQRLLPELGVPVLQMIPTQNSYENWIDNLQSLTPLDVCISVAQPEFDGNLITSLVSTRESNVKDPLTGATVTRPVPVKERIGKIVSLALNWGRLRHIPAAERKIAIIFHHYPPRNDLIGAAFGLDSFESVNRLLQAMQLEGYTLNGPYKSGEQLAFTLLDALTNDRRFLQPEQMARRAVDQIDEARALRWHGELPPRARQKLVETWGKAPGTILTHQGRYLIPGLLNGNVYIGLQPVRGKGENDDLTPQQSSGLIHDPDLVPPHQYAAVYRWIKEDFGAHAVIHIGKHGTLEWLPGKSVGLGRECFPDIAIQDLPNIYPYIINNPGEGTQAKRRSYACIIDHLIPPMMGADKSGPLQEIEDLLDTLYEIRAENPGKVPSLVDKIWEKVEAANLHEDLGLERAIAYSDIDAFLLKLHGYLNEVGITAINDGLHILGECPQEHRLVETLVQYLRLPNTGGDSLWETVAQLHGYDDTDLRDHPGEYVTAARKTKGQIRTDLVEHAKEILQALEAEAWICSDLEALLRRFFTVPTQRLQKILRFVQEKLVPDLHQTEDELTNTLKAARGEFVDPGASGAPTRGTLDILPTGRNFYSVDPQKIPSLEAWENGVRLGDALVQRYLDDTGKHPEQIGMVLWSSPTMRTRGDDIAEIFYLMGLKPVWHPHTGKITGVSVIPLESLKFPRIDITLRTSGLFRDTFPNIMELIDEGIEMIAALREPADMNFLARNVAVTKEELMLSGISETEAAERARYRIFSCKPGAYGTGTEILLGNKRWETADDLGEAFMQWGAYAYSRKQYGNFSYDDFRNRLGRVQLTLKNEDSREHDILVRDDWVIFQGGMNAAIKSISGKLPVSYMADASDPRKPRIKTSAEEARFIFRARILNPKWIEGCKRHGFKGAAEFVHAVEHSFEWDATSEILSDWQYESLADTYALDPEMQQWLKEHNPYALQAITEKLMEAVQRNLWDASEDYIQRLQNTLLDIEGDIEDTL
ncbi:MAG: cobaltochelatase subunit CobN [Opitutales bacterium]|nr:cobaltochelatase subunit CobN [Opitutales bacterium]